MTKFSLIKQASLVASILLLAGCTSSDEPIQLKDGGRGYKLVCSGWPWAGIDDCKSMAKDMCGQDGYTVIDDFDLAYGHTERAWDHSTHDLVVRCNNHASVDQVPKLEPIQQPEPPAPLSEPQPDHPEQ